MVRLTLQPVFTHLHEVTAESPSEDLKCMWTVLTKSKKSICQGDRLENLSWRLWYTSTRGFRRLLDESGNLLGSESALDPKHSLSNLATPPYDEVHNLVNKSLQATNSDSSSEYTESISKKSQPLPFSNPRLSPLPATELSSSPSPSHKFILQSLSHVLEEIRDSVPTKKQSKSQHSTTDSASHSLPKSSSHKSSHGARQRTMTSSQIESHKSRPSNIRDQVTRHRTRSCLSSHNESEPEASDSHYYSSGTDVKSQPGYSSQNSSLSPTSKARLFGESSLQGIRSSSSAAAQRLSRIYHATGRTNKADLPGYALDEEQYKEDPNDPYQHIPVTTFPYDEQQFELANQAFKQANISTTSLSSQQKKE